MAFWWFHCISCKYWKIKYRIHSVTDQSATITHRSSVRKSHSTRSIPQTSVLQKNVSRATFLGNNKEFHKTVSWQLLAMLSNVSILSFFSWRGNEDFIFLWAGVGAFCLPFQKFLPDSFLKVSNILSHGDSQQNRKCKRAITLISLRITNIWKISKNWLIHAKSARDYGNKADIRAVLLSCETSIAHFHVVCKTW